MAIRVKLYANKEEKQYKIAIPKKIADLQRYKHKDEFELEIQGKNTILKKGGINNANRRYRNTR